MTTAMSHNWLKLGRRRMKIFRGAHQGAGENIPFPRNYPNLPLTSLSRLGAFLPFLNFMTTLFIIIIHHLSLFHWFHDCLSSSHFLLSRHNRYQLLVDLPYITLWLFTSAWLTVPMTLPLPTLLFRFTGRTRKFLSTPQFY